MVASYDTVDKLYMIMRRHLSYKVLNEIMLDLTTVPGNKSFRDTVERLLRLHGEHGKKRCYGGDNE